MIELETEFTCLDTDNFDAGFLNRQ